MMAIRKEMTEKNIFLQSFIEKEPLIERIVWFEKRFLFLFLVFDIN